MTTSYDPRLLAKAARPGRIRGIALDTWAEAVAHPLGASGRFRRAQRDARALHSRERRLVSDAWHDLPASAPLLRHALGHEAPLALWLGWLVQHGLPIDQAEAAWTAEQDAPAPPFAHAKDPTATLPDEPIARAALLLGIPEGPAADLLDQLGDELPAFLASLGTRAPVDVRVHADRADRERVAYALKERGLEAEFTPLAPYGLRLPPKADLRSSPEYRTGLIEPQDEASQLIASLVDQPKGARILDYCAGAGGKTLALAADRNRGTTIFATDVRAKALEELRRRLKRAGERSVKTAQLKNGKPPRAFGPAFDRVLVDAPCTGSGIWRRHPSYRWRLDTLDETLALQDEVLDQAAQLVSRGGRLIYATCSVLRAENEDRVKAFLARHPDFQLARIELDEDAEAARSGAFVRTWPHKHGCDGFFGAVLDRWG